jgi:type II secretory pathway component PulC
MGNLFSWPMVLLVQRLSMVLTLGCCVYVLFFLFFTNKANPMIENSNIVPAKAINLLSPSPAFDLKSYDASEARDVFSLPTAVNTSGTVEGSPQGQLPEHLKIVGLLIAHPSQIIIEDDLADKTYFIKEGSSEAGIKIVRVSKNQMIINYQGQEISVPISKN